MEDIIEELVGEIYDENDEVVDSVVEVAENVYDVQADMNISGLLEKLELPENLIETDSNTVGGWVMELFGRIPETDHIPLKSRAASFLQRGFILMKNKAPRAGGEPCLLVQQLFFFIFFGRPASAEGVYLLAQFYKKQFHVKLRRISFEHIR